MADKKSNQENLKTSHLDRLAQGISSTERKDILNRMKESVSQEDESDPSITHKMKKDASQEEEERLVFSIKLKKEPFYIRFWVWLKSFFSESSAEEVYNGLLVSGVAREIEHHYPDLLIYKRKVLYNSFYEKLLMLAKAADFFKPYVKFFGRNPGAFYMELSKIVMPGIVEQIQAEADPYQYLFDAPLNDESVKKLRQALMEGLNSISVENQREMYQYAQMLCWLEALVKIPFDRILDRFGTSEDQARLCLFTQIKSEVEQLARVICNYVHVDERIIGAFILFLQDTVEDPSLSESDNRALKEKNFHSLATSQIAMIEMFISNVPMEKLTKVVLNNYLYIVQPAGGGEKWFEQFSDGMKKAFEKRLREWKADYEKQRLKTKLLNYFHLASFPVFPYRPWEKLTNGMKPNNALSIGFVNYFVKQNFNEYMTLLKGISLEGEFSVKKNQKQLSAALDKFEQANNYLDTLASDLSPTGQYGGEYSVFDGIKTKNDNAISHMRMIMAEVDDDCARIIKLFKGMCYELEPLVSGFISGRGVPPYGCIMNIGKILRRMGNVYEKLNAMALNFSYAYELIVKLQEIEDPDKKN